MKLLNEFDPMHAWQSLKSSSLTVGPENLSNKRDEVMMAVVFDYPDELFKSLFKEAEVNEMIGMINLFNKETVKVRVESNGCLTIS